MLGFGVDLCCFWYVDCVWYFYCVEWYCVVVGGVLLVCWCVVCCCDYVWCVFVGLLFVIDVEGLVLIWCLFFDVLSVVVIVKLLFDEWLVVCVNILLVMFLLFEWNGECGEVSEVGVLFKIDVVFFDCVVVWLVEFYFYDELVVFGWYIDVVIFGISIWLVGLLC